MSDVAGPDRDNAVMSRLRLALERELHGGEAVVWHGWQLARLELRSFGLYVFAIPWTAFSLLWTTMATLAMAHSGDEGPGWIGWAFPMFGLPFVGVGLWMLARPFLPLMQKGRVLYVVTDHRVLKLSLWRELEVQTVPAGRIGYTLRHEQRDGTGRLQIAVRVGKDSDGDRQIEFFEIGNVADVIGAQEALNRIAATTPRPPAASGEVVPFSS